MVVLIYRRNYKCVWYGILFHIFFIDGGVLRIREAEAEDVVT